MSCLTDLYVSKENRYNVSLGKSAEQLVVMLPGAGCTWAKQSGGCYMCGFSSATHRYSKGRLLPPLIFRSMLRYALNQSLTAEVLAIYNGGSFLNSREIPASIPNWLCEQVAGSLALKQLFVESRPEYVQAEIISGMIARLGTKGLQVGIGLECVTDDIREKCVHKGFSLSDYGLAIDTLRTLGARSLTYVLLKPPFLSEREAIEEAVETIEYAFQRGSDEVALESAFVQPATIVHRLYKAGQFEPPWLWSIIEVVTRTAHLGPVYLGGFTDEPKPIATPTNCPNCSDRILANMERYRSSHDLSVLRKVSCSCKSKWHDDLSKILDLSVVDRAKKGIQNII